MRFLGAAAAALTAACLAGCTTPAQGFYWGSYDQSLYAFSKRAEKRDDYAAALQKAIDRGRATKRLAPGLQAELGFLKLENGAVHPITGFTDNLMLAQRTRTDLFSETV
jgi:hypothetical protein